MSWQELYIQNLTDNIIEISDFLTAAGALAVSLQDAGDQPLYEPDPNAPPLWQYTTVIGLFDQHTDIEKIICDLQLHFNLPMTLPYQIVQVEDKDWLQQCKDLFKTIYINEKLRICPSWDPPKDNAQIATVTLDPGLAFGTGSHATTQLCLKSLATNLTIPETVIDYGCGSGILAMAAIKLGSQKVFAVDIDEQALEATRENAKRNGISNKRLQTYFPKQLPNIKVDFLVANILAEPLLQLLPEFSALVKPGGGIVLSGILDEQAEMIIQAYRDHFVIKKTDSLEGWSCLSGKRLTV
jgi:ribosomal protein L11 methyltransferase